MGYAAETKVAALYLNSAEAVATITCLEEIGHTQPTTPLKTDNITYHDIINRTTEQEISKSTDMIFYWLRDQNQKGQFHIV